MSKHTKPQPITGDEFDLIYAKKIYCYLQNNNKTVKKIKKQMNKRFRRKLKQIDLD